MRLGDLDDLKAALTNTQTSLKYMGVFTVDDIKEFIDNTPTVETDIEVVAKDAYMQGYTDGWKERFGEPDERPQGKWVIDENNVFENYKKCSYCGEGAEWLDGGSQFLSNFCPNCGAKMKGGAE